MMNSLPTTPLTRSVEHCNTAKHHGFEWCTGRDIRLYVQTHEYHQNVECIRTKGDYAPTSVADLMALVGPEDAPAQSADETISKLITGQAGLAETLHDAIAKSGEVGDEVSAGMLTDRLEWHEKSCG